MTLSSFEKKIIQYAESQPHEEVCGFVLLGKDLTVSVLPMKNEHEQPDKCFSISPKKFIDYKINYTILGVYHSHPSTAEQPSEYDIKTSEELGIPYLIYSIKTKKFYLYCPESYDVETIIGRPYVKGFYECTSIFRDYFNLKLNKNISKYNNNYWLPEKDVEANKLLNSILDKHFLKVNKTKIRKHDVIVFQLKESKRCHVGVYEGDDYFVHQPNKELSCKQMLDERWQSKIKEVYRHNSLV